MKKHLKMHEKTRETDTVSSAAMTTAAMELELIPDDSSEQAHIMSLNNPHIQIKVG